MNTGIHTHPHLFPGLTPDHDQDAFHEVMHKRKFAAKDEGPACLMPPCKGPAIKVDGHPLAEARKGLVTQQVVEGIRCYNNHGAVEIGELRVDVPKKSDCAYLCREI